MSIVLFEGGGSNPEIVMNVNEMQEIMRYITTIEISFENNLAPKLQTLSSTKYYEGGEASQTLQYYSQILNKVLEAGDLYRRANSEILNMMNQWLEQDAKLKEDFMNSLSSNPQLAHNLKIISGGDS